MKRLPKPKLRDRINTALKAGRLDYLAVCKIVRLDNMLHRATFQCDEEGMKCYIAAIEEVLEGAPANPVNVS